MKKIEDERSIHRERARKSIERLIDGLRRLDSCLAETKTYPVWLIDLEKEMDAIGRASSYDAALWQLLVKLKEDEASVPRERL